MFEPVPRFRSGLRSRLTLCLFLVVAVCAVTTVSPCACLRLGNLIIGLRTCCMHLTSVVRIMTNDGCCFVENSQLVRGRFGFWRLASRVLHPRLPAVAGHGWTGLEGGSPMSCNRLGAMRHRPDGKHLDGQATTSIPQHTQTNIFIVPFNPAGRHFPGVLNVLLRRNIYGLVL